LHYFATRPISGIREYTRDVRWTHHPQTRLVFVDTRTRHLKTRLLGDPAVETVVAAPVKAFLISTNLDVCLYQRRDGAVYAACRKPAVSNLLCGTSEHFSMNQAALSPSGENAVVPAMENIWRPFIYGLVCLGGRTSTCH
jgi:hypothetical protein